MERVGGFGGKADQLNYYNYFVGTPDYFQKDLDRYGPVVKLPLPLTSPVWAGADFTAADRTGEPPLPRPEQSWPGLCLKYDGCHTGCADR